MKALRFHGKEDIRIEDIPEPQCGPGQVKVAPAWCGICGSDLHEYLGGPSLCPTSPHPITGETVPLTFGHEFSGHVEEVGKGVTKVNVGDKVCIQPIIYDDNCVACEEGLINCCWKNGFVGLSGWGGGLSEHVVVLESAVYKLPDNVSLEVGALVEPLAVGWHAVNISPWKPGSVALVLGGGPIGLAVIQALKARGDGTVIVSELSSKRKAFATQFGADIIIDPVKEDLIQRCKEITKARGVDVVYDCAGIQAAMDQAVQALRARGTYVNIAIWEKTCTLTPNLFNFKERSYLGVATYQAGDYQDVIDAISSGRMKPEGMITKRIKLNEVVEEGFSALIHDKENQVKILVAAGQGL
ncbi:GroES-like protein [Myriangium duriaei CBS 260.36]|uniref:GroES-like protein n=1 Tax=Myriangium duriaei CBS 260.36 TaxID=1168546 RepID=A0A9P4IXI2_9PEZI|nr:GroES-like protein [Myriangium duriaei CBS 260.36]